MVMRPASTALLAATLWAIAGWIPWDTLVASPWARTGVATFWFLVPGLGLARWIRGRRESPALELPTGFALSVALQGLLGLVGCALRLSPAAVMALFTALGFAIVVAAGRAQREPGDSPRSPAERVAVILGWIAVLIGARLAFDPGVGSSDDLTGFARTAFFRFSDNIGFGEHVVAGGGVIAPRYWIAFWPLAKAMIAFVAHIDPLPLATIYLPPFLVAIALLASFSLARRVGLSVPLAWVAVAAQVLCLVLLFDEGSLTGTFVLRRTMQDKAAAASILTPVFLGLVAAVFERGDRRSWALAGLAGIALTTTHGEAFGITALFAGTFGVLYAVPRRSWRALAGLVALLATLASPHVAILYVDHPMTQRIREYGARQIVAAPDMESDADGGEPVLSITADGRYGLNPSRVLHAPHLLLLAAALLGLRRRRTPAEALAQASVLVLAAIVIPYTGSIIGRIITPPHLARIPWFAPYGLAIAVLAARALERSPARIERAPAVAAALIAVLSAGSVALAYMSPSPSMVRSFHPPRGWESELLPWRPLDLRTTYADLAAAGRFIDEHGRDVVVMGDRLTNDLLPGIGARARLVFYRKPIQTIIHRGVIDHEEAKARREDWLCIAKTKRATAEQRAEILERRGVEYLIVSGESEWLSDLLAIQPAYRVALRSNELLVIAAHPNDSD